MKKIIILMCGFTILFATIFYEAQISIKVGKVYEVPFQGNESFLSNLNIDVDEERIKSKAAEILRYLFEEKFNASDYKVSVNNVRKFDNTPCYSIYFYNTKTQMEGYILEFEIGSGDIVYIWNNEFEYSESGSNQEKISEEKLQEVAEEYLKKIHMDEVNNFQLMQKIYLMAGIQFTYKDDQAAERFSILLNPETAEFMCYMREIDL